MFTRRIVLAVCAIALACSASTASAAPPPAGERIAPRVTAAGADVSGLTIDEAAAKLDATFGQRLKTDVSVKRAGRLLRMSAKQARVKFDALRTAKRALYAGRTLAQTPQAPGAAPAGVDVALAVDLSQSAVRRFAGRVDRRLSRSPRNSKLRITLRKVRVTHSRPGRDIDHVKLAKGIAAAFADPRLARVFRPKLIKVKARVNSLQVRRRARTVITLQRSTFTLRLFKNLRWRKSYKVAVGQPAYPTPRGLFSIQSKQVNPTWSVPNSPWAGELAGTSVSGGSAANPLKARWMGITGSVGIHGTGQDYSIGTRASHGCIRMHVWDVIALYNRVPIGTPVLIR
ncbi:MAG: L,D-transpeptidase/peptidoglycan binding protein [Actinomycetota bacterium]|nr:L,D-transpeptidase/peptidoglycan binding protein [Actinomycetota bacterium]